MFDGDVQKNMDSMIEALFEYLFKIVSMKKSGLKNFLTQIKRNKYLLRKKYENRFFSVQNRTSFLFIGALSSQQLENMFHVLCPAR